MTENTTASGAAYALLHILDAIKTGRFVPVGPESLGYCKAAVQAAERALAASAPVAPTQREEEMSMLIRRIVSSARRNCEDNSNVLKLANEAWSYLVRQGLQGSPLRDAPAPAPAPQPAAPEGYVLVPVEPTPAMGKAAADAWLDCGSRLVLNKAAAAVAAGIAAAPKAASLQPDWCELRRLHAIAVAVADADRILAEWRAYKPAPLQQDEYLPLPEPAIKACHCYSTNQVREAIDADRAARGAAQASPAPVAEDADDAARWRLLPLFMQGYDVDWVELLYNLEVTFKRGVRAQAAQPKEKSNAG